MPNLGGVYRWGASTSLNITSGTATASTAVFGSQTRTIRVVGVASCNALIIDGNVSSVAVDTAGMPLIPNTVEYFAVGPGQRLAVHGLTVTSNAVWVTEAS